MGQHQSAHNIQEFFANSVAKIVYDEASSLFAEDIVNMTYEDFIHKLGELNKLSKNCLDSSGKQLLFAVKKGTDSTMFWKATVQIACVKIDPNTNKVDTHRLLNLKEFLHVFRTLKCQHSAAEQSTSKEDKMTASSLYENINKMTKENDSLEIGNECCICLERKPDISLPCAHSYCLPCIEEWNQGHHNCPICREQLQSTDDTWVLSEVPNAEEISAEIRTTLMHLAEDKPSPCFQS